MAKKAAQPNTAHGVHVIFGEDKFLLSKVCEKLLDTLLEPDQRAMALYEPRPDTALIADVLDELRTLPFLAPRRVVLMKDAEPFIKANAEYLEKYLDDPSPSGVLILVVTSWDKRTRLHKKMQKTGGLVEVGKMYGSQLPAYVTTYAAETFGIRLDNPCSRFLVELVGDDAGRLCREMDKLATFVAPKKTVTLADIEHLIGQNRMFDAFGVIDAINAGQIGPALSRLRNMFQADRSTEYTVVGAFGFHFRRLFRAKGMVARGVTPQQAALKSGVRFKQDEFCRQLNQMSLEQLAAVMAELGRIDFGLKTGRTTAAVAIERLITNVFLARKT